MASVLESGGEAGSLGAGGGGRPHTAGAGRRECWPGGAPVGGGGGAGVLVVTVDLTNSQANLTADCKSDSW